MADDRRNAPGLHVDEPLDEAAIREFSSQVRGRLIRPDDDSYDEVRAVSIADSIAARSLSFG
jgi:hypothetical protein